MTERKARVYRAAGAGCHRAVGREVVGMTTTASVHYRPGDRLWFDGKFTRWLVRAVTRDGRYTLATASLFGQVHYTILDAETGRRGAMNVIGWGLSIFTTHGPDPAIDDAIARLEEPDGRWTLSHRNNVATNITRHEPAMTTQQRACARDQHGEAQSE